MTAAPSYDALVIGGGIGGLAAAAYLARARKRTLLVEARSTPGGLCQTAELGSTHLAPTIAHAIYALDPHMVRDLKLTARGLRFAVRDAPLTLLGPAGERLVITRDVRATARRIAVHSRQDAEAWPRFRKELLALARALRAHWWEADGGGEVDEIVRRFGHAGSGAWLDSWFESNPVKALLAFDSSLLSPLDAGSALLLVWRAAQEMCGLQGAVALIAGGPGTLVKALVDACKTAGAEIRTETCVTELLEAEGRIVGVRLNSGECIAAPIVLSSLSRRRTLLDLAGGTGTGIFERRMIEAAAPSPAAAKIIMALDALPEPDTLARALTGRLIVADRPEDYALAHADVRAGRIPQEPTMEVVFPTIADPLLAPLGGHVASILVQPVPLQPVGGWQAAKAGFAAKILSRLDSRVHGLLDHVVSVDVLTPDVLATRFGATPSSVTPNRILADWPTRVKMPLDGLYLCGADAEPVPSVSGRAGRIAASLAIRASGPR